MAVVATRRDSQPIFRKEEERLVSRHLCPQSGSSRLSCWGSTLEMGTHKAELPGEMPGEGHLNVSNSVTTGWSKLDMSRKKKKYMWFKEVEVRVLEGAISTPATCLSWRLSKWQSI